MKKAKKAWRATPSKVRKPVTLLIGLLFVVGAGLTGWLPGPGGIPLFLIGIAILATEFEWAERLRDWFLEKLKIAAKLYKEHRALGTVLVVLAITVAVFTSYSIYRRVF